jgi:hypothetical protein
VVEVVEAEFSAFNSSARDSTIHVIDYSSIQHVRKVQKHPWRFRLYIGGWEKMSGGIFHPERKDQVHLLCHDMTDIQDLYKFNLQWTGVVFGEISKVSCTLA